MATDDAAQLADHFREICQEWNLSAGEAQMQAHNTALAPLHAWLLKGMDSPEVVIRAVQVLMADPERPASRKRPAVKQIFKQISQAWGSVGLNEQDVLILRGMLLATWPRELREGGFALAPLLDSAWVGIRGRVDKEKHLQEWRKHLLVTSSQHQNSVTAIVHSTQAEQAEPDPSFSEITAPKLTTKKVTKTRNRNGYYTEQEEVEEIPLVETVEQHHAAISALAHQLNASNKIIQRLASRVSKFPELLGTTLDDLAPQQAQVDLLWWGQARYSSVTRHPYRRIADDTERLWWMAWESSELATALEVEPAACFLIETLYQLDKRVDAPKRPLKEWLAELLEALRRIHGRDEQHADAMTMSDHLETLAREDALGLPVTWARLQAANPKPFEGSLEERIRMDIAVDPDTLLDLGDWAAWVFREALLDHRLWEFGE